MSKAKRKPRKTKEPRKRARYVTEAQLRVAVRRARMSPGEVEIVKRHAEHVITEALHSARQGLSEEIAAKARDLDLELRCLISNLSIKLQSHENVIAGFETIRKALYSMRPRG